MLVLTVNVPGPMEQMKSKKTQVSKSVSVWSRSYSGSRRTIVQASEINELL